MWIVVDFVSDGIKLISVNRQVSAFGILRASARTICSATHVSTARYAPRQTVQIGCRVYGVKTSTHRHGVVRSIAGHWHWRWYRALVAIARKLSADCKGRTIQHSGDFSNAAVLLLEADDRHAIFGWQLLVLSGTLVHWLTFTGRVLHFLLNPPFSIKHLRKRESKKNPDTNCFVTGFRSYQIW